MPSPIKFFVDREHIRTVWIHYHIFATKVQQLDSNAKIHSRSRGDSDKEIFMTQTCVLYIVIIVYSHVIKTHCSAKFSWYNLNILFTALSNEVKQYRYGQYLGR